MITHAATKPKFSKNPVDAELFNQLRQRIFNKLQSQPVGRLHGQKVKAIILPVLYAALYVAALSSTSLIGFLLSYAMMGFLLVIIFANLIHDAVHQTLFAKRWLNKVYCLLFDCMGANSYIWMIRHKHLHHNYPNVLDWDVDIEKSNLLKVHPAIPTGSIRNHPFVFLLYPFFLVNWLLVRDFKDFFDPSRTVRKIVKIPAVQYLRLFLFKVLFFAYTLALPLVLVGYSWWLVVAAWLLMMVCAGIFGLMILLPPHTNGGNFFPVVGKEHTLPTSWLRLQLSTTNDVYHRNFFTKHFLGNSNFHVVHHLFPNISQVYTPELTDILSEFCLEHQLPYRSLSYIAAFKQHFKHVWQYKSQWEIWEEDM